MINEYKERIRAIAQTYMVLGYFDEQLFINQLIRFFDAEKCNKEDYSFKQNNNNEAMFEEGTLIHGTYFNEENLKSIHKNGIITGQALGIEEDGETFNCADFWRVKEDTTIKEYDETFESTNSRTPFKVHNDNLAFVLKVPKFAEELASYDCYRENENGKKALTIVNEAGLPSYEHETLSSIIYGLPSNCIQGIVIGDMLLNNEDKLKFIYDEFNDLYIFSNRGVILNNPHNVITYDNFINEINKIQEDYKLENIKKSIPKKIEYINELRCKLRNLLDYASNKSIDVGVDSYELENVLIEKAIDYNNDLNTILNTYISNIKELESIIIDVSKNIINSLDDVDKETVFSKLKLQYTNESIEELTEIVNNDNSVYLIENLNFECESKKI